MSPRVDSGNLAAALIALAQGLASARPHGRRALRSSSTGLRDNASLLAIASSSSTAALIGRGRRAINRLARSIARKRGANSPADVRQRLGDCSRDELVDARASLDPGIGFDPAGDMQFWRAAGDRAVSRRSTRRRPVDVALAARIAARAAALADAMRFDFLYDRRRRIFAIGYRLADAEGPGRLEAVFYDLLASEARLASFVAIAKGDVPQHHWFHLGRLVTNVDGRATLMSWGGTMFEYLMPHAADAHLPGHAARSELPRERAPADRVRQAARRAVGHLGIGVCVHRSRRQLSVPGVRRAGPRPEARAGRRPRRRAVRDRAGRLVDPAAAAENFERLAADGLDGRFGFYESLDYRPRDRDIEQDARRRDQRRPVVRAYFAHHQGMSLVALANVVCDDAFVARFHADPRIQATELLLQERVPREAILSEPRPDDEAESAPPYRRPRSSRRGDSGRRTPPVRTRSSCRTAATRPR